MPCCSSRHCHGKQFVPKLVLRTGEILGRIVGLLKQAWNLADNKKGFLGRYLAIGPFLIHPMGELLQTKIFKNYKFIWGQLIWLRSLKKSPCSLPKKQSYQPSPNYSLVTVEEDICRRTVLGQKSYLFHIKGRVMHLRVAWNTCTII